MSLLAPPGFKNIWYSYYSEPGYYEILENMRSESELLKPNVMRRITSSSISFTDVLSRRLKKQNFEIEMISNTVDGSMFGEIIYEVSLKGYLLTFVVFSNPDREGSREGRLRDNQFDLMGALIEGRIDRHEIDNLSIEMRGKVWQGRTDDKTLAWTFANRSQRAFNFLSENKVDKFYELFRNGGYIVRNAGCYANGRHGTRTWISLPEEHPLKYPYLIDMLCLYLWRKVGFELLTTILPESFDLDVIDQDHIGVGNSSGIGTIATLIRWPAVLSAVTFAREFIIAHFMWNTKEISNNQFKKLIELFEERIKQLKYCGKLGQDTNTLILEQEKLVSLLKKVDHEEIQFKDPRNLLEFVDKNFSETTQEYLRSAFTRLDVVGTEIAEKTIPLILSFDKTINPVITVGNEIEYLEQEVGWALKIDFNDPGAVKYFWYKSEENGENRRGERLIDEGAKYETFIGVAREVCKYYDFLNSQPKNRSLGRALLDTPHFCMMAARLNLTRVLPYTNIQANLLDESFIPADVIRFFLSLLGLSYLSDVSNQWVSGIAFAERIVS